MGAEQEAAIADFVRRRDQILKGERFQDASTALNTLLSFLSACMARDLAAVQRVHVLEDKAAARFDFDDRKRDMSQLEIFRAPPPPAQAKDGDIWVMYTRAKGEGRLDDGYFFIHWKQRWVHGIDQRGPQGMDNSPG